MNVVSQSFFNSKDLQKWAVLFTTLIGGFMVLLNNSLMNVALPYFMNLYEITAVQGQWVITAYVIGMVIIMPLTNFVGKRFGNKKVFLFGTIIFLLGSSIGILSWDYYSMTFFRIIQGFGGGLIMPLAMVLIFENFPKKQRGFAMGIWGVAAMSAPSFGPLIGGIVLELTSWKILFIINIPVALIVLAIGTFFLPKDGESIKVSFDWLGFIFITIAILAIMAGVDLLQVFPGEAWVILLLVFGAAFVGMFIRQELICQEPLLNIRILKNKVYTGTLVILSISVTAMFSVLLLVPLLKQDIYAQSAMLAGLLLLPQALFMGIAMSIGGRVLDKKGSFVVFLSGLTLTAIATFVIAFTVGQIPPLVLGLLLALHGIGSGLINTPATTVGLNALKETDIRDGAAFNNIWRQVLKVICVIVLSIFFEMRRGHYLNSSGREWIAAGEAAVRDSFLLVGFLCIVSVPLVFYLKDRDS